MTGNNRHKEECMTDKGEKEKNCKHNQKGKRTKVMISVREKIAFSVVYFLVNQYTTVKETHIWMS